MQAADAVHVASSARRAASEASGSDADAVRPNSSERPDSGSVRPGGPGAERLAGIEGAPVRAAASARLVQSQAATVAPAAVRGAAAVPVSAPVRAAAATCFLRLGARRAAACRLWARDAVVAPRVELFPRRDVWLDEDVGRPPDQHQMLEIVAAD